MKGKVLNKEINNINYNYATIKVTKSRIEKGLLAIPISLTENFPLKKDKIAVFLDSSETPVIKNFTPYKSSSHECRIGGMKKFFVKYNIQDNDEIVIEFLDNDTFRIITENRFRKLITEAQKSILANENDFKNCISLIEKLTNKDKVTIVKHEFFRLANDEIKKRKRIKTKPRFIKEDVPKLLRSILELLYEGKCQISGFTFFKKSGKPYFEIHHINPELGNHVKNLLVVSPNVHAQFTFANVREFFDTQGWLRKVKFNDNEFSIKHIIDDMPKTFKKETHIM